MKKLLTLTVITASLFSSTAFSVDFNDTENILERSKAHTNIEYNIMVQRATQAAIHYMPAVTQIDFLKATRRAGGDYNTVMYINKPFGSEKGFLTANDTTAYAWSTITTREGVLIVEVPPASEKVDYFGSFVDAWEVPLVDVGYNGADKGKGGKYAFLPVNYDDSEGTKAQLEKKGYIVVESTTSDIGFAFRPTLSNKATHKDAGDYAQRIKIYPLAEGKSQTHFIDATDLNYDCLPYYNMTFFEDINDVVQNNPIRLQDKAIASLLKDVGIEKGKEFSPNSEQIKAIKEGTELAYAHLQNKFTKRGETVATLWNDPKTKERLSEWSFWNFGSQANKGFTFDEPNEIMVDKRAATYFYVTYLPKNLGGSTFYLTGLRDSDGEMLNGEDTYVLNVPADTPAKDFWSAIVYNMETKNFNRNVDRVGASTKDMPNMVKNSDGSVDIYFGPNMDNVPTDKQANFVTTKGEDFFLLFRLYRPTSKTFFKDWMLGDLDNLTK